MRQVEIRRIWLAGACCLLPSINNYSYFTGFYQISFSVFSEIYRKYWYLPVLRLKTILKNLLKNAETDLAKIYGIVYKREHSNKRLA